LLQECVELRREGELRKQEKSGAAAAKEKALITISKAVREASMLGLVRTANLMNASEGDEEVLLTPACRRKRKEKASPPVQERRIAAEEKNEERRIALEESKLRLEQDRLNLEREKFMRDSSSNNLHRHA
jgi:hypothetical protein